MLNILWDCIKVIYRHNNLVLDMDNGKGKLYVGNRLRFMGDPYVAITMMLRFSENHPDVRHMFRHQLEMREKPRFTKADKPVETQPEPPKKEKVMRRPRQNKMEKLFR